MLVYSGNPYVKQVISCYKTDNKVILTTIYKPIIRDLTNRKSVLL